MLSSAWFNPEKADLLPGFEDHRLAAGPFELRCRIGGNANGEVLLLLHGYPQTHVCWHRIAPSLAERFRVVIPDLPGCGDSSFVVPDDGDVVYSKRSMAAALVSMMDSMQIDRFGVVAHDRGARVVYRMTLDHPDRVTCAASPTPT